MYETYFGVDVHDQLIAWIEDEFAAELTGKYGSDAAFAVVIETNMNPTLWAASDGSGPVSVRPLLLLHCHGDEAASTGEEGLVANISGKLNFVYRTGLPSSEARIRPDLIEPGDFPFAGAGTYRGYTGGVSAFKEEADWWVYCRIIDKLIDLRSAAAQAAVKASRATDRKPGEKYLRFT